MVSITIVMVFLDTFGTKVFKNGLLVYGFPHWCLLVYHGNRKKTFYRIKKIEKSMVPNGINYNCDGIS